MKSVTTPLPAHVMPRQSSPAVVADALEGCDVPADDADNSETDDQQLAARFAAGERDAADEVIRRFSPQMTTLVRRLLAWPSDVDDVVQDVFVAALSAQHKFRGDSKLATWLTRIAVNRCRAHNRTRWLRQRLFATWANNDEHEHNKYCASSESSIVAAEVDQQVRDAVHGLPHTYREVVVMFYLEEMTAAEVADSLGIRRNTIEVRLNRARKMLAEKLDSGGK